MALLNMKYIVVSDGRTEKPYIFSSLDQHINVARGVITGSTNKVISGGFVTLDEDVGLQCYGESISCSVQSRRKEDTELLLKWLKGF